MFCSPLFKLSPDGLSKLVYKEDLENIIIKIIEEIEDDYPSVDLIHPLESVVDEFLRDLGIDLQKSSTKPKRVKDRDVWLAVMITRILLEWKFDYRTFLIHLVERGDSDVAMFERELHSEMERLVRDNIQTALEREADEESAKLAAEILALEQQIAKGVDSVDLSEEELETLQKKGDEKINKVRKIMEDRKPNKSKKIDKEQVLESVIVKTVKKYDKSTIGKLGRLLYGLLKDADPFEAETNPMPWNLDERVYWVFNTLKYLFTYAPEKLGSLWYRLHNVSGSKKALRELIREVLYIDAKIETELVKEEKEMKRDTHVEAMPEKLLPESPQEIRESIRNIPKDYLGHLCLTDNPDWVSDFEEEIVNEIWDINTMSSTKLAKAIFAGMLKHYSKWGRIIEDRSTKPDLECDSLGILIGRTTRVYFMLRGDMVTIFDPNSVTTTLSLPELLGSLRSGKLEMVRDKEVKLVWYV